jgi:hypothetical membrane protein
MSWKRIAAYLAIIGPIQFVIITAILMAIYPFPGYNFLLNTFSSLGLTVTNGVPTPHHHILFSITCTFAAIIIIPFFLALRTLFTKTTPLLIISWIGTIIGLAALPFLSALAIFAGDAFPSQHSIATQAFFLLIAIAILIYSVAMLLNNEYSNLFGLIGIIIGSLAFVYFIGILASVPGISSAAMQKVAVYGLVLWSAFQGYYLLKLFPKTPE